MTDPIGTAQERELIEEVAQVIQREAIDRGADSPVDYGDAEQLARAVLDALQSRIAEVGELRQIIAALGYCTPDASLEFMRLIPGEVEAKCAALSLHRRPT